jgi:L-threonylcarbamoyladenylate synthase
MIRIIASSDTDHAAQQDIHLAAAAIRNGECVIFPTETCYGIAARADDSKAVARLYDAKKRPADKPCAYHIGDWNMFHTIAGAQNESVMHILSKHLPGPVTFLLDVQGKTHGFRFPAHPLAQAFLTACAVPVIATSANISGTKSPVSADDTLALAKYTAYLIDAGSTPLRGDSTLIDLTVTPPRCLRKGVGEWNPL